MSALAATPPPWRAGRTPGSVVADEPSVHASTDARVQLFRVAEVEYYGGSLIAESVAPYNLPIVITAPEAVRFVRQFARWWDLSGRLLYGRGARKTDPALAELYLSAVEIAAKAEPPL